MKMKCLYYFLITLTFVITTFNACKPEPEPETQGNVTVTTSSVSNITETSAKCGGSVTATGYSIGACGLCYSEMPNPTINSYITSDMIGTGTFTSIMSGLQSGTKYCVLSLFYQLPSLHSIPTLVWSIGSPCFRLKRSVFYIIY